MRFLLIAALLGLIVGTYAKNLNETIPFYFPLYKQCDSAWGSDLMVTKTICQVGCLMSSVSMGLSGSNIDIEGLGADPGTLNTWLQENGGYDDYNDLIESVVPEINPDRIVWPDDGLSETFCLFSQFFFSLDQACTRPRT